MVRCAFVAPLLLSTTAVAAILEVGTGAPYATIAAAAAAARDNDTIHIRPGTYTQGAVFYANNLTIAAVPGSTRGSVVVATGVAAGKGLFNVKGDNTIIDNIRFRYANVPDGNGAGVRAEGMNITIRNSMFDRNEMGVLLTPRLAGSVDRIENSSFDIHKSNKSGRIGHSVYATGNVGSLAVTGSTFKRNFVGHYIKSRADVATITGNIIDDTQGTASYLIDLPEGGAATISGNTMTKGVNASNCCVAISFGSETSRGGAYANTPVGVIVANNTFTNKRESTVRFVNNLSQPAYPATLTGNRLIATAGTIVPLAGLGTVDGAAAASELLALAGDALLGFSAALDETAASDFMFAADTSSSLAAVPAPGGALLGALGLAAVVRLRRRR